MRSKECPKCGEDISDSYQGPEPDVGIMGGWYCDKCDLAIADEDGPEPHDDDVQIFGTGPVMSLVQNQRDRCPKCLSTNLEMGYGLAGGGFGPYSYCTTCGIVVNKSQEPNDA
jgi:hypothetical protein